ncbi:unnamed protein product [Leuciscus chuanchicus]
MIDLSNTANDPQTPVLAGINLLVFGLTQTGPGKHELGPGGVPVGDPTLIPVKGFIQTSPNIPSVVREREEKGKQASDPLLDPRDLSIPPSLHPSARRVSRVSLSLCYHERVWSRPKPLGGEREI